MSENDDSDDDDDDDNAACGDGQYCNSDNEIISMAMKMTELNKTNIPTLYTNFMNSPPVSSSP